MTPWRLKDDADISGCSAMLAQTFRHTHLGDPPSRRDCAGHAGAGTVATAFGSIQVETMVQRGSFDTWSVAFLRVRKETGRGGRAFSGRPRERAIDTCLADSVAALPTYSDMPDQRSNAHHFATYGGVANLLARVSDDDADESQR